jgi:hypothetical protein
MTKLPRSQLHEMSQDQDSSRMVRRRRVLPPSQPLRNRSASANSRSRETRDRSNRSQRKSAGLARAQSGDHRCTSYQLTRDANSTKKALQKIYSLDLTRRNQRKAVKGGKKRQVESASNSSARNVIVVPKFTGCSQGGLNSSF